MYSTWSLNMKIGDLIKFDEEFYESLVGAGVPINKIGIIREVKDMFYCIQSGDVNDLWVSPPDVKKIYTNKQSK